MQTQTLVVTQSEKFTGLSNYATALSESFSIDGKIKLLFVNDQFAAFFNNLVKSLLRVDLNSVFKNTPLYLNLPKSIVHFTSQQQAICLNYLKRKAIVTVHDIIPLATNTHNSFLAKILYLLAMRGLKRAKFIIADSEYTKKDIIKFLNYPEQKIKVIPLGVDHTYFKPSKIKRDNFTILYVGSEMPRKNLMTLFKAFQLVKQKIPSAKLVKVGLPQWPGARNKLVKFVKENNLESSVIFKDYIENLAEEYQRATVFVFPSKYEGFGLPPLEAMACGCPVICSNATSLPEVVGDSAILFSPDDSQKLADEIVVLLSDKKMRARYSAQGIKRAGLFTWQKCAKETILAYLKLEK